MKFTELDSKLTTRALSAPGRGAASRRGSALLAVVPITLLLGSLGAALLFISIEDSNEAALDRRMIQAESLAEAGATRAIAAIAGAHALDAPIPQQLGTSQTPLRWASGSTWTTVTGLGGDLFSIDATARVGSVERRVQAVVDAPTSSIYEYAIFAGNSSGDPNYELRLSGSGSEADSVDGSLFSAGDIRFDGDSYATGEVNATGVITGGPGNSGVDEELPDLIAMAYELNNDYDVAALFDGAAYQYDSAGGSAFQVPESNPAHIFRKHPSNRTHTWQATTKEDYFLEDPYEAVRVDSNQDGTDPYVVTLSGDSGEDKVFYIDGNLWIDNTRTFSLQLENDSGEPLRATFVVSGNITFTDNLFYENNADDAVVFIALEDPLVPDSGNIKFGDPTGGTLEHVSAFMYAENDFTDFHLDQSGTKDVTLFGNMTAGNHVNIERDFVNSNGTVAHSQLQLTFDNRVATGSLSLEGLPTAQGGKGDLTLKMWRHVGGQSN